MMKLALNQDLRKIIEEATSFLDDIYSKVPLKIRCYVISSNLSIHSIPRCKSCNDYATYDKAYNDRFIEFCSDKCKKSFGTLPYQTKLKLNDRDWLYEQRITNRLSYPLIGNLIGCSETPIVEACKRLNIPHINLTESKFSIQEKLSNREYLTSAHITNKKTLNDIAIDIGSSKSTVSVWMKKLGIKTNKPNSYDRGNNTISKECFSVYCFIIESKTA